jgi:hypothetical protein
LFEKKDQKDSNSDQVEEQKEYRPSPGGSVAGLQSGIVLRLA